MKQRIIEMLEQFEKTDALNEKHGANTPAQRIHPDMLGGLIKLYWEVGCAEKELRELLNKIP